jgi:hypothetical protein
VLSLLLDGGDVALEEALLFEGEDAGELVLEGAVDGVEFELDGVDELGVCACALTAANAVAAKRTAKRFMKHL